MQLIDTKAAFAKALDAERGAGRRVGLVPTMGFLHDGHASLMDRASAECDVVAATIFVNPLQFGPTEDLDTYPRDFEGDCRVAEAHDVTYVFAPSRQEMFRERPSTTVSVAGVSAGFEGASRPTHFDGVATIVAKLFALAGRCRAYFGEKDYQQLAVIRRLAADLSFPVDVIGCRTVREADGLALSSRNAYLQANERAAAPVLYGALLAGREQVQQGETDPAAVQQAMRAVVATEPLVALEYADVVAADLQRLTVLSGEVRLLIAARLGRARLIDNMGATV